MSKIPTFTDGQIESMSKLLGEVGTGSDISRCLSKLDIIDHSGESTKWRRLYSIFSNYQHGQKCSNMILRFIETFLDPSRFVGRKFEFDDYIHELNSILRFSGLEYRADGKFKYCETAKTLDEAEKREQVLLNKLKGRIIHEEVYKYCKKELLQENYFHAVFEAAKGLAQRIRDLSNISLDGSALIDKVFSVQNPILAFNTLRTETEKSEHKGFASLLKGCFSAIRNPLAHEPKILWDGENDAADYMTLISLLHRKLDSCILTRI